MKIAIFDPYLDALGGGEKYMMTAAMCLSQKNDVSIIWDNSEDIEKVEERFALDLSHTKIEKNFLTHSSIFSRLSASKAYNYLFFLSDGSIPVLTTNLVLHFQFPIEWVSVDWKTKLKLKRVKKVVVNSEFTKKYIDKKLGVKSIVLYPPVQIQKQNVAKENIILHVGRFMGSAVEGKDYKKQYFMIETFKKMIDSGLKDWKFVLAAGVRTTALADFQKMQATAAGYPISFIVNATNQDLWKEYSRAKIYWHASGFGEDLIKHPERAEHFGISTVEAMGAGAVPVVINAGGQIEVVKDGVNGMLWNTEEEFISKTKEVIENTKVWERLSKDAEKNATKFSLEKFNDTLLKIFA
jgi:glycosyltransferase involved in cell wall biosynthesis